MVPHGPIPDDEWGEDEEEEVVVWSNDIHDAAATAPTAVNHSSSNSFHPHSSGIVSNVAGGGKRDPGGHPLLIASVANLAISYNVVRASRGLAVVSYAHLTTYLAVRYVYPTPRLVGITPPGSKRAARKCSTAIPRSSWVVVYWYSDALYFQTVRCCGGLSIHSAAFCCISG